MILQITVDKQTCILCGLCEQFCPSVFTQEGQVTVDLDAAFKVIPEVQACVELCPMDSIKMEIT